MIDLKAIFAKHADEYAAFERVVNRRHPRPDLCAFLMLHDLAPRDPVLGGYVRQMVQAAKHDELCLDTDIDLLATNATEDDIVTLIRCGISFNGEWLSMLV